MHTRESIILTTLSTGYNYGSSLQAYATRYLIEGAGYNCILVRLRSIVKGRDIYIKKLLSIIFRSVIHFKFKSIFGYSKASKKRLSSLAKRNFAQFESDFLKPVELSWRELKHLSQTTIACVAGSDQIWNSESLYVDPLYYLRFAPKTKRISFASSFGRGEIAEYNRKLMGKWIAEFSFVSVREDSGVNLVQKYSGKSAVHIVDPTLLIDRATWTKLLNIKKDKGNYILAYFLDEPSPAALNFIHNLKNKLNCEVWSLPYSFEGACYSDKYPSAGPREFVELVSNAECVITDSFHGTAFSINMHTPFCTFSRQYGTGGDQSERILSLLQKANLMNRYNPAEITIENIMTDFTDADTMLLQERHKAHEYLNKAITILKGNE